MERKKESFISASVKRMLKPNRKQQNTSGDPSSSRIPSSTSVVSHDVDAVKEKTGPPVSNFESLSNVPENNATSLNPQPISLDVPVEEAGGIAAESLLKRSSEDIENSGVGAWYRLVTVLIDG